MPTPTEPNARLPHDVELDVHGVLPAGLSGRWVTVGPDGIAHSISVQPDRVVYASHRTGSTTGVRDVVPFAGSLLVVGDDLSVRALSVGADPLRRVDLAGKGRDLVACPTRDSRTGELHLLARDRDGADTHVVVAAGALTRRVRPISAVAHIGRDMCGLALTSQDVVLVADGAVGVLSREREARVTWTPTGAEAPHPVGAHVDGETVVLVVTTPALERWTVRPTVPVVEREVLDPTPRACARACRDALDAGSFHVWSAGGRTISRHDVVERRDAHLTLTSAEAGAFVLVPDPARLDSSEGGWFVGLVHHTAETAALLVIDMAEPGGPPVAAIRLPLRLPRRARCGWVTSPAR